MYSCQCILEYCNLFSGVKLSIRLFCFITSHYLINNQADEKTILTEKLKEDWGKFKFDLHEWKSKVSQDVKEEKHPS